MALQVDIPLNGGITHSNGYVRVVDARVFRKDGSDSWYLMVDVSVYKDANERAESSPTTLRCSSMDKFKYAYSIGDETSSNLVALAYTKLKTESAFSGASEV